MYTIGLVVYPGFQALALGIGAVFEYANLMFKEPVYDFKVLSEYGGPVATSQGFAVSTTPIGDASYDTLIVAADNDCQLPPESLLESIRQFPNRSRRVMAVCTGAFALAAAGLLEGKRATTHWFHAPSFRKQYPNVLLEEDRIFVVDGSIWTSAGMSAGLDMALEVIENDLGAEIARAVARKMVMYQRRGGGQSQFSSLLDMDPKSDRIQLALNYAKEHLKDELSVEVLADAAHLSPRQFSRVFRDETGHSPAKAIERLRVEAARAMMESTRHPVEVIARESGFGDRERMRQAFLRAFGQPPQSIRRSVGTAEMAAA